MYVRKTPQICRMDDESRMLGYYGVESGMCIHVIDEASRRLMYVWHVCAREDGVVWARVCVDHLIVHTHTHKIGPLLAVEGRRAGGRVARAEVHHVGGGCVH